MPQLSFSNLNNTRVAPNSTTRTTRTTRTPSFLYALWSFHVPIHPLCDVPFESCGKERNVENVENVKKIHQWLLDVEGPVQLDLQTLFGNKKEKVKDMGGAQSAHAHHHHHKAISSRIKKLYTKNFLRNLYLFAF